ncbi:Long-chain acyl-CoA thioesterase FadM [Aquicella siphonis]|uniref:Long-chain acyl-CoA thioesterase FadM n=1 Tax=Aquicella siphonis TaxID=254247 RepID=A0A5E4PKN7_9COXI|nr:acyl-CoA thioesterase [Aquicella siphonis]VVC76981.1 Long-chain acyl-CoA thioesterase FadM [Aquicella siphonis]
MLPFTQSATFLYPVLIREHHLDTFGHVNNATYLELLESARWEFITSRGFGLKKIQESGLGPTVLEIQIKFIREIRLREEVIIESVTLSYEKKIGKLRQMIRNADQHICCEAHMTFGLFNIEERKLVLPTPEWLYAVGITDTLK